jgi:Zn-dependent protease with chaperone function
MPETPVEPTEVVLTQIAPAAWEHPTDRAALDTLRAIPAFDEVVRKIYGFLGETGVRLFFQANAVRVGPTQFPRVHAAYLRACRALDVGEVPPLFVTQTPFANAGAFGMDRPFIVLNSGVLALLDEEEIQGVLGHELGHVLSEHALYRTILEILLSVGMRGLPFLTGVALLPIQVALLEWSRKSELSCDRAGLLANQNPMAAMRAFLKLAGGGTTEEIDVNAFLVQAREYEENESVGAMITKVLNTLGRSHPFNTLRAAGLQRWIEGGAYDRILRGDYPRRGQAHHKPLLESVSEAKGQYATEAREALGNVADAARKARDALGQVFTRKKE